MGKGALVRGNIPANEIFRTNKNQLGGQTANDIALQRKATLECKEP
jgi:hypothetical protein